MRGRQACNMKVLSYVIYGDSDRYWENIPYLLVANSLLYPDFAIYFYIDTRCKGNIAVKNLLKICDIFKHVKCFFIEDTNKGTSFFQLWRMKPLWDSNISFLFCRDVDYALSTLEYKAVQYFLNQNKFIVHSMRTYRPHDGGVMAGLCGFNTKAVLKRIQVKLNCFEDYVEYGMGDIQDFCGKDRWRYGGHQALLLKFLRAFNFGKDMLEFYTFNAWPYSAALPDAFCYTDKDCLDIPVVFCNDQQQNYIDSLFVSKSKWEVHPPFIGKGWTCPKEDLKKLTDMIDNEISVAIKNLYNL